MTEIEDDPSAVVDESIFPPRGRLVAGRVQLAKHHVVSHQERCFLCP